MTRLILVLFATAACALLSACGGGDDKSRGADSKSPDANSAEVRLSIEAHDGRGTVKRAQLVCNGDDVTVRGLPTDRKLCATARNLAPFLSQQPPADRVCTQIYGGPETARIVGQIEDRQVDRRFSRSDGCRVSDWDRAQPLIPIQPQRKSGPR